MPSQIVGNLCSDVQVNPRNKEIPPGAHQTRDVTQTTFCRQGRHMTEKIARDHNILGPQGVDSLRLYDIADLPLDAFLYPRFDCDHVPIAVEQVHHLRFIHSFKNIRICQLWINERVLTAFTKFHRPLRDVHRMQGELQIGSSRSYPPCYRISLHTRATAEHCHPQWISLHTPLYQTSD